MSAFTANASPAPPLPPVTAGAFWPETNVAQLREAIRVPGDVLAERLRSTVVVAVISVTRELSTWRAAKEAAGYAALAIGPRRDEGFVSSLCNRLATLSTTAQHMAEGGNSDLPVVGLHHAQQMVRKANATARPPLDLHRLIPPLWLSDQIGGPLDDLTPGQAWRDGFNECRTRMQLQVEQVNNLHQVEVGR